MFDPNDNLKRLLLALHSLAQSKNAMAGLQALVATDTLLTFFLFGRDYFGWWPHVFSVDEDGALLAFMVCLSFALFAFLSVLALLYFTFQPKSRDYRSSDRAAQPRRRPFTAFFGPATYGLPVLWGRAELTGTDPAFWGTLAVAYMVAYQATTFTMAIAEQFADLERKHQLEKSARQHVPRASSVSTRKPQPSAQHRRLQRWWRLTHPWHLRRMRRIDRSLYGAVTRGDVGKVAECLSQGARANLRVDYGVPLISVAVGRRRVNVVRMLLEAGAKPDAAGAIVHYTALMRAASIGDADSITLLLEHGAVVDSRSRLGLTSLILAGKQGNVQVVQQLLNHGAQVNACTLAGVTALMLSCYFGHAEAVKALLDAGADPSFKSAKGLTAQAFAERKNHPEIVAILTAEATTLEAP